MERLRRPKRVFRYHVMLNPGVHHWWVDKARREGMTFSEITNDLLRDSMWRQINDNIDIGKSDKEYCDEIDRLASESFEKYSTDDGGKVS